jgi:hypothetical protein
MEGGKEAFCILLWAENGGRVDSRGKPVYNASGPVRGNCVTPYDCYGCPLMQKEVARHPPGYAFWVCPACVAELVKDAKTRGASFHLPGHYTEGQCQYQDCTRPARTEGDEQLPERYSRFLQLIIYGHP